MKSAKVGDVVVVNGFRYTIAKLYYEDCCNGFWNIEFLDANDGYHNWKQAYDGGTFEPSIDKTRVVIAPPDFIE